jgi:hypothetical protein
LLFFFLSIFLLLFWHRSLLAKALRKKHFYKETIRIEKTPGNQSDLNPFSIGDWIKWDPLSSGEGDLPSLEDISKLLPSVNPNSCNPNKIKAVDFDSIVQEKQFHLSQHADKLHDTEPVSGDREETEADEMQLDDQRAQMEVCFSKDDDISLVPGGSNKSDGTLHPKIEFPLKICNSDKNNPPPVSDEMHLDDQAVLLKECHLKNDVTLVPGGFGLSGGTLHNKIEAPLKGCSFAKDNSAPGEMQRDDQVALLKECDLKNDDINAVPDCPPQSDKTLHNNIEAPLKECNLEKDNYVLLSDGYGELCMETGGRQCDIEAPLSDSCAVLVDRFVEELGIPFIQSEHSTDQNAPEGVVGICDGTVAITCNDDEATVGENNCSSCNLIDEVYAETKKINQMKNDKEGEVENINNRDAIVETDLEENTLKIDLIDDEEKKTEKVHENIDVEEEQERELKIIKLDDSKETIDATAITSSSISLTEAVLHDLGEKQDWETTSFAQGPSFPSSTKGLVPKSVYTVSFLRTFLFHFRKFSLVIIILIQIIVISFFSGKRKQKGLPFHQPYTMSFKGPFKHMLFRKKSKR